jgi:hypothetical protein
MQDRRHTDAKRIAYSYLYRRHVGLVIRNPTNAISARSASQTSISSKIHQEFVTPARGCAIVAPL